MSNVTISIPVEFAIDLWHYLNAPSACQNKFMEKYNKEYGWAPSKLSSTSHHNDWIGYDNQLNHMGIDPRRRRPPVIKKTIHEVIAEETKKLKQ